MTAATLQDAKAQLVRERVLDGVQAVLAGGEELTFARVSRAAGVPERTVYRHFPTRDALMMAVFDWANARIGFAGTLPTTAAELTAMVRTVFPGFDTIAPVVDELLGSPEGREARRAGIEARRSATVRLVHEAAPALEPDDAERLAAVVQVLASATVWQALRDLWDLDGADAADAVASAIDLLLAGARAGSTTTPTPERSTS